MTRQSGLHFEKDRSVMCFDIVVDTLFLYNAIPLHHIYD